MRLQSRADEVITVSWGRHILSTTLPIPPHTGIFDITMRLFRTMTAVQLLAAHLVAAVPLDPPSSLAIDIDEEADPLEALTQLQQHTYDALEHADGVAKRVPKGCSLATTTIRRDW